MLLSFLARSLLCLLSRASSSSSAEAPKSTDLNHLLSLALALPLSGSNRRFSPSRDRTADSPPPGFEPPPLGRTLYHQCVGHWSEDLVQRGVWKPLPPEGPPFPSYRGHPQGVFTGPWVLGRVLIHSNQPRIRCDYRTPPHVPASGNMLHLFPSPLIPLSSYM